MIGNRGKVKDDDGIFQSLFGKGIEKRLKILCRIHGCGGVIVADNSKWKHREEVGDLKSISVFHLYRKINSVAETLSAVIYGTADQRKGGGIEGMRGFKYSQTSSAVGGNSSERDVFDQRENFRRK